MHQVDQDAENSAVVKAILYLARTFGLEVCAEGVETEAELEFLREQGCQTFQGYLRSEPLSVPDFDRRFMTS